ncbi:protein kinase [Actinopolymorpha sp. B17G11]|uniref:serine/threonine-protein kinase n=1 Tax=Actinopolymorpha sp. B17G11 TaxID=3160861 RepID=UPI0032E3CE6B
MQRDLTDDASTVEFTRLDGYLLRERIGEGGMGVVHRATDTDGRVVAIKLLRPHVAGDSESRARFAREAQVLARVRGRHVAQVLDADVAAATPYLVTDFVAGPPLHEVVERDGPLDGADLADLAGDLADALCSIHGADVVHRDLKPGNVLLDDGIAVVIDFGIAQIADDTRMTVPGLVYGTPGYVAPEILHGSEITAAADIHSWAATVAYAATGRSPFGKGPLEAVAYRVLHEGPDLDGCPDWLFPVLELCFAKDPAERPSAPTLLRWLETGEPPPDRTVALSQAPASGIPDTHLGNGSTTPMAGAASEAPPLDTYTDDRYAPAGDDHADGYDGYDDRYDPGADPGEPYADDGEAADTEERTPEPSWPVYHGPVRPHRVVTTLAFAVLAALAAVVPLIAAGALTGWLVVSRTVDRSARFLRRRRSTRGRRGLDPVAVGAALPWHFVRSVLVTALTLPIAVTGAGILVGVVVLFFYAGAITPRWDLVAGGIGLVVAALAWWGVEGEGVQHGSQRILSAVLRRRWVSVVAGAVLAVVALVLATVASTELIQWWPLEQGPLPRLDWPG